MSRGDVDHNHQDLLRRAREFLSNAKGLSWQERMFLENYLDGNSIEVSAVLCGMPRSRGDDVFNLHHVQDAILPGLEKWPKHVLSRAKEQAYQEEIREAQRVRAEALELKRQEDERVRLERLERNRIVAEWWAKEDAERQARLARADLLHITGPDRALTIYRLRREGFKIKDIAERFALSLSRVGQLNRRGKLLNDRLSRRSVQPTKSRPIDMGGPRDVWLVFHVEGPMERRT